MSCVHYTSTQIDQHMRGQAWHIESVGIEHSETDRRWRHITTAWTVHIIDHWRAIYEVAQWSYGTVYKTHTITIRPDGSLTCTCPAGQKEFAQSARGFCGHINRLTLHATRRLPTLPLPADEWARIPRVPVAQARTTRAMDGKPPQRAMAGPPPRLCLRWTPQTTTVMWMP